MTGVDLVHVPYRSNFYPDLLSGQVEVIFATVTSSIGYIKAGQLRVLGVTTATHVEGTAGRAPNRRIPTLLSERRSGYF
jgi:tripartite-type tricarboxylate transporter receptor subunit TctC